MIPRVKGMNDKLSGDTIKWQALEKKLREIFSLYNYQEIRTPLVEYSQVFHRENENSDMVTKETFNFLDRSDRKLTLRPEGTAGIVRSFIENKLYANIDPVKLYYMGTFYRYERPQKGRYREFSQFGVEVFSKNSPLVDFEVISLAYDIVKRLGLKDVSVNINSLGDFESREEYKNALVSYFTPHKDDLCEDCQKRLSMNPLRILDCKIDQNKDYVINAPKTVDYLSESSLDRFNQLKTYLDKSNISYKVATNLVRGLDYYSNTVFEIQASIPGFGPANTLGGGGVYQNLVHDLGGPVVSGIGFAFGMDRIIEAIDAQGIKLYEENNLDCFVIPAGEETIEKAISVLQELRDNNLSADYAYNAQSFKAMLKNALRSNAKYLIILGDEEIKNGTVTIKNTKDETQESIKETEYIKYLRSKL